MLLVELFEDVQECFKLCESLGRLDVDVECLDLCFDTVCEDASEHALDVRQLAKHCDELVTQVRMSNEVIDSFLSRVYRSDIKKRANSPSLEHALSEA
jgi:hypothetical protein